MSRSFLAVLVLLAAGCGRSGTLGPGEDGPSGPRIPGPGGNPGGTGSPAPTPTSAPFNYLDEPADVTPVTMGAWVDVNVSSFLPADATGAILHVVNPEATSQPIGLRMPGSTDNRVENADSTVHFWGLVGVTGGQFQAYRGTGVQLHLEGWTGPGVTFLQNGLDRSPGTTGVWTEIDLGADTGSETAVAAIVEVAAGVDLTYGLRPRGSSDFNEVRRGRHLWAVVGLDGNERLDARIEDSAVQTVVVGWIRSGLALLPAPEALSVGNAWADVAMPSEVPSEATGALVRVLVDGDQDYGIRQNGSTQDLAFDASFSDHPGFAWSIIALDGGVFEARVSGGTLQLLGYTHD